MKANTITDLKEARLYAPTMELYGVHLKNCAALECPPEPFEVFAADILNATPKMREEIFNPAPREPYAPFQSYPAYRTPITPEMFTGTPPGSNRPRGKRKPKKKAKKGGTK